METCEFGNLTLTLYDAADDGVIERQCKLLDVYGKKSPPALSRFAPAKISGKQADALYEREMGRWDKPFDPQFAYTGGRKGDKDLLASLASVDDLAVAA